MNHSLKAKLDNILAKHNELEKSLENEAILSEYKKVKQINIQLKKIEEIVNLYRHYKDKLKEIDDVKKYLKVNNNDEFYDLLKIELKENEIKLKHLEEKIQISLLPKDDDDNRNVLVEIRGAAGGNEANIFAADLFEMYRRYSQTQGWKLEIQESNESSIGGISQIIFSIRGSQVYKKLKYEAGIHRVQRVPITESKGKVHTSTASVAILPEVSDIEIKINPSDLKIDTYRASGAGGQHINTTDSAVRITHLPTGTVATSQDGRSQHDNKDKALSMLRSRIYEQQKLKSLEKIQNIRTLAVGSGMRAEKIRTYNYPQNRITDHRINLTLNKLDNIMMGNLDELITSLASYDQQEQLNKSEVFEI